MPYTQPLGASEQKNRVNNEQYLTLQEYAKRENVTIQTVYNWIKNKKVETKKILNMTLIKC